MCKVMYKKLWVLVLALTLVLLSGCMLRANEPVHLTVDMTAQREASAAPAPLGPPAPETRSFENTLCYMEQGGAGFVCQSGGSITLESGASLAAADASVTANNIEVGGGFGGGYSGGSGCSLTSAGALKCDGPIYTRSTLGVTGPMTVTGDLTVSGTSTVTANPTNLEVGGGFGGGYAGGSGCSLTSDGAILCDSKGYFRGTLGVTGAVTTTGALDVGGTLNYGANDLYPVGYASSGKAVVTGQATTIAVGSVNVTHGLSTIDSVQATLCQVPTAAIANVNAVITATTVTLEARDSTFSNRANGANICYTIIGSK